jgi:hypothetical protein
MEYRHDKPVTQDERENRSNRESANQARRSDKNRERAVGGGQLNELGNTEGQNGEQGNTVQPRNTKPPGKPSH